MDGSDSVRMPTAFVTHGAPTLPLEPEAARAPIAALAGRLPRPKAVLCVSAHWETDRPTVSAAAAPETVHDFFGFPEALYRLRYPAPGAPALAARAAALLSDAGFAAVEDGARGLDHGAWVPLMEMYPRADVPVAQISVGHGKDAAWHMRLGAALAPLRDERVLILGSGSATHNLRDFGRFRYDAPPAPYVRAFDDWLRGRIEDGDEAALCAWRAQAPEAARNHPSDEHLMPLFVPLGAAAGDAATVEGGRYAWGVLAMTHAVWGNA